MSVEPATIASAWPCVPEALLTVATPMADELQVTELLRFFVVLSL
jgi:hypothetical protein